MKSNNQLALWAFGDPAADLKNYLAVTDKKAEDGTLKNITAALVKRKEMAQKLGLTNTKGNKRKIDLAMLEMSDQLKAEMGKQVTGIVGSSEWTGRNARITRSKNGAETITFSFSRADRSQGTITVEEAIKALVARGAKAEEIKAMFEQARREAEAAVDVPSVDNEAADTTTAEQSVS